ncbi:uncharacterized protein Pyn_33622 [Prunus yedoensis var. nudiflora]|uniref:Uncharacterized protein n=1 Tax=Prunus yedoensis var. nudiflora TaxID=2094558 RepID=A0A315AA24_PRUYE|nr:uncharacterized protein Pyn_33622 [Prunus yedoensis var. nudiflora]
MLRTRLLWFGLGFSLTGAAISHLVWKDLLVDRCALSSDVKQKFDALEGRIVNSSVLYQSRIPLRLRTKF